MIIEQNRFSVDIGETKVIWHIETPIIVPLNFTDEQEKYLKASLRTLHYGNVSVDNVLKRYYTDFEKNKKQISQVLKDNINHKHDLLIDEILKFQKKVFNQMNLELLNFDFTDDSEASSFSGIIFKRLKSSFNASRVLIKQGFYFETYSLIRQMLEQIAFAFNIHDKVSYDEFISPTKCISSLKDFYPYSGKFYGLLSSKTHIDKSQFEKYFYIDNNNEGQIILQSLEYSMETAIDLLIILDLYCCSFEFLFKDKISKKKFLTERNTICEKRKTRIFYLKMFEKYKELYK